MGVKTTGDESEGNGKKGNMYREREIPLVFSVKISTILVAERVQKKTKL